MGMAASQARYLALVARKSNCEYEGQQINQARLILSKYTSQCIFCCTVINIFKHNKKFRLFDGTFYYDKFY